MNQLTKICPFCDGKYSEATIKKHISIAHLDLIKEECNKGTISDSKGHIAEKSSSIKNSSNLKLKDNLAKKVTNAQDEKEFLEVINEASELFNADGDTLGHDIIELKTELEKSKRHGRNKRPKDDLVCETCKKVFRMNKNLKRHIETVHLKIKKYSCMECGKSYPEKAKLLAHTLSAHHKVRFDCSKCEKSYASKIHLRTHFKVMHEEGISANIKKCSKCSYSSVRKSNLKRHMIDVHKEGIPTNLKSCPILKCEYRTVRHSSLNKHLFKVHEIEQKQ